MELRAMAQALGAAAGSVRTGVLATETSVKTSPELSSARVVAFATHGLLSNEIRGIDEPGLVFTPPAKASSEDDGLLTASEAARLKLSADWVILSACNTAGADGSPGADSLSGLARAFLYAGAKALLASHWHVFDDSTAALTVQTLTIQRADPRLTKAQALQKAMLVVRTGRRPDGTRLAGWNPDWAHPAYWAPFVLIGAGE
jgi:CHAT domain-containing protein